MASNSCIDHQSRSTTKEGVTTENQVFQNQHQEPAPASKIDLPRVRTKIILHQIYGVVRTIKTLQRTAMSESQTRSIRDQYINFKQSVHQCVRNKINNLQLAICGQEVITWWPVLTISHIMRDFLENSGCTDAVLHMFNVNKWQLLNINCYVITIA